MEGLEEVSVLPLTGVQDREKIAILPEKLEELHVLLEPELHERLGAVG